MTESEFVQMIKSLQFKQIQEREKIEDEMQGKFSAPFYSGLISYASNPVSEAIHCYEGFLADWETEGAKMFPQQQNEIKTARRMIELLKA